MIRLLILAGLVALICWAWRRTTVRSATMSLAEAARVLGVAADADADTIIAAHKRMIARVHPDAGGNAELAARVNQARDILLRSITS